MPPAQFPLGRRNSRGKVGIQQQRLADRLRQKSEDGKAGMIRHAEGCSAHILLCKAGKHFGHACSVAGLKSARNGIHQPAGCFKEISVHAQVSNTIRRA